jgi:copper(I)-binding protein
VYEHIFEESNAMLRRTAAVTLFFVLAVGVYTLLPGPRTSAMLVENPVAKPVPSQEGVLNAVFTLANPGAPDALIAAQSDAADVEIVRPEGVTRTAIPQGGTPAFSLDGVYLRLSSFATTPQEGDLIPIELTFERSEPLSFKARVEAEGATPMDHAMMDHSAMDHAAMVAASQSGTAPTIAMRVDALPDKTGWRVTIAAQNFRFFKPEGADMAPDKPGEGHAHLYLDGLKVGRMYEPIATIGALPPGTYTASVSLNTNMHAPVLVDGAPVGASFTFEVE